MPMTKIDWNELALPLFPKFRDSWALLSSGKAGDFNAMTVSWGQMGELWGKEVCTVYVRHSRYTLEFMDKNDLFTLSFLSDGHKKELGVMGSKSGRDIDKMSGAGLTPMFTPEGCPAFEEAELTLVCRKMYKGDLPRENFLDAAAYDKWYPDHDIHTMFIGEIVAAYTGG